ncbi:clusterin-associated protein 1 homolog isoform X2 [Limulus polyphemus]|uniref:Clusterin-associated protein 1 homolog isoform X2 n=1 Tax=Limulus polyphemus TaxID=6850 RepID=A0ABM1BVE5_LIMPO|nr:clusterin-associated protein 1 homolog isoform X2 [Limulus polyphemus]
MSYRDLRNFTEMMRALGYTRLISMENFRNSNFPLVAEILKWLVKRYDPNSDTPTDVDTEQDRVIFIKYIAQFMVTKAHIKLNPKRLYMADGYAVKELLKISTILYDAMRTNESGEGDGPEEDTSNFDIDLSSKLSDLKRTRQLASEITTKGASLYDLLAREVDLRDVRSTVISKQLEITELERGLRNSIREVEEEIQKTNNMIENVASDEANLEAKIEKRKIDLERNQKRLQTLKAVRPAFMDEYERLEQDLEKAYEQYLVKFRCLAFLEQHLEDLEKIEEEQIEEREIQMKKMVEKLRQEELLRVDDPGSLENITNVGEEEDEEDVDPGISPEVREKPKRPQPAASGVRREAANRRVFGSMTGDGKDSLDTDSDLDLEGEDDDASDASSDEEMELNKTPGNKSKGAQNPLLQDSDNDF